MSKSPTKTAAVKAALADIEAGILSAYAAAKKYGVAESSISRARKRQANKQSITMIVSCPHCDNCHKVEVTI